MGIAMTLWTTGTCDTNGIEVNYLRTGGNKPPVVLLHGLMTKGACWTPLAQALAAEYDVIMPDARGHGNSSIPNQGYHYNNLANDVMGLIDKLELESPVLLGHSMGGMTAAVVASQNPKRLRGLVLADPAFLTPERQREVHKSDLIDQHRRILNRPKEEFLAVMQLRSSHRSPELNEIFAQARFQTSINAFGILTPPYPDYLKLINGIDVPCLLVIGDDGSVVSAEMATEFAKINRHIQVAQITQAGHGLPFDQPQCFSDVVSTFLRSMSI